MVSGAERSRPSPLEAKPPRFRVLIPLLLVMPFLPAMILLGSGCSAPTVVTVGCFAAVCLFVER